MTGATVSTSAAMLLQLSLGLAVFQANRRRLANQCFLLLSLAVVAWLGSLLLAFGATTSQAAEFAIRQASAAGAVYLAILNFLRLSIRQRQLGWKGLLAHSKAWLFLTILVVILCQTVAFLKGAVLSEEAHVPPRPEYGPAVWLYSIYIIAAFSALIISYWHDIRNSKGAERAELSFIFIGAIAAVVSGLLLPFVLDYFLGPSRALWFAPFRMIGLSFVMAYGIATRKILEVGFFMRRAISYGVLAVYLIALYALIFWLCYSVFVPLLGSDGLTLAHVIASVVVAFAMAPARGVSRSLADRLFVGTRRLDFQATMNQATAILRSVTTLG